MIGFITLAGISARNGILKICTTSTSRCYEGEQLRPRADRARLAGAADAGADDGAVGGPRADRRCCSAPTKPGREILHPVAVTIFGGLLSATLLDTLLTPLLFLAFGRKPLERLIEKAKADGMTTAEAY